MTLHREPRVRPTTVLLVGEQWESVRPLLTTLAEQEEMVFLGPSVWDLDSGHGEALPEVVLVGPGSERERFTLRPEHGLPGTPCPPVLVCVTSQCLQNDDLYADADDFLLLPCTPAEMSKRIKRLALRSACKDTPPALTVGNLALDRATYQVTLSGRRVDLAWLEFQLLKFFMENPGRVFTREQLLAQVWGIEDFGGTRTVDVHIRRLRHKLEVHGETYFRTVKNVGYGMVEPQ